MFDAVPEAGGNQTAETSYGEMEKYMIRFLLLLLVFQAYGLNAQELTSGDIVRKIDEVEKVLSNYIQDEKSEDTDGH